MKQLGRRMIDWVSSSRLHLYITGWALTLLLFLLGNLTLFWAHRTFFWTWDGLEQQFPFFLYQGRWLRAVLGSVIAGRPEVVLWEPFGIYGVDALEVLMNTIGNPVNLISVFSSPTTAEFLMQLTLPITLILAATTFLAYCEHRRFERVASLMGLLTYLFSCHTLLMYHQVHMIYPLVLAPIILLGTDRIFNGKGSLSLIVGMALLGMYSLTGTYMACILLFVYCLSRYVFLVQKKSLRVFLSLFVRMAIPLVIGIAISAFLFVPMAMNVLGQDRIGITRTYSAFYSFEYLQSMLLAALSFAPAGADCYWSLCFLGIICLVCAGGTTAGKAERRLSWVLLIGCILILVIPAAGRVMNGFSYPNNRWTWMYNLLMGVVVARDFPALMDAERSAVPARRLFWMLICLLALSAPMIARLQQPVFFAVSFIALAILAVVAFSYYVRSSRMLILGALYSAHILMTFNLAAVAAVTNQVPMGEAWSSHANNQGLDLLGAAADARVHQFDATGFPRAVRNAGFATGLRDATCYNSFYHSGVDAFHTSLGLATSFVNFSYEGLNARPNLEFFAGVDRFATPIGQEAARPWQFSQRLDERTGVDGGAVLFGTHDYAPTAWVAPRTLSRKAYEALPMVVRERALLDHVVLDEASDQDSVAIDAASAGVERLAYTWSVNPEKDMLAGTEAEPAAVEVNDHQITVWQPGACVYLKTNIPAERVLSVAVRGLEYAVFEPDPANGLSLAERYDRKFKTYQPYQSYGITVTGEPTSTLLHGYTSMSPLYAGKTDWVACVGYSDEARGVVTLCFNNPGIYTFSDIELYVDDLSALKRVSAEMPSWAADEQSWSTNAFRCTVDTPEDGSFLMLRIPYSSNWIARVDGQETSLQRADLAFMALKLSAGQHRVELAYHSRPLELGLWVSFAGMVAAVLYVAIESRMRTCVAGSAKDAHALHMMRD
ncbi:YfhO family protein [Collinsella sp. AGMB00827]|uniref:YfhO family protein n=1 Tax=Collinsella ureilytica TaxID=2869515 RepID=A0ABS7MIY2_9ACTN|nr:YfhO family protein [Collinsella urealyticum]MBY4796988.1 YfhO family protein [Collinsella urealyticum]